MIDEFVVKALESIIMTSLGGPGGDPDYHHKTAAAHAYAALDKLGKLDKKEEGFVQFCDSDLEFMDRAYLGRTY